MAEARADPPPQGRDSIRVVNATQRSTDIFSFGEKELSTVLSDLAKSSPPLSADPNDHAANRRAFESFGKLAREMRDLAVEEALPNAVPMIATRQLLYDRGVAPLGRNVTKATRDTGLDVARPPIVKELWQDTPASKKLVGQSPAVHMVAAPPEARLDLEGLMVVPSALARSSTFAPTGAVEKKAYTQRALRGDIPDPLLPQVGKMLVQVERLASAKGQGPRRVLADQQLVQLNLDPREASPLLRYLAGVYSNCFAEYRLAAEAYPELRKGRLDPTTYTYRTLVGDRAASSALPVREVSPEEKGIARLGRQLNSLYSQIRTGAMSFAALLEVKEPTPGDSEEPVSAMMSRKAVGHDTHPSVFPLVETPGEAEEEYAKALKKMANEIQKAKGTVVQNRSPRALNYASEIYPEYSLDPVRDYLTGQEDKVESFLMRLRQDRKNQELIASLQERTQQQMVKARQYLVIIEEKLGTARYEKVVMTILTDPVKYDIDNPADILEAVKMTGGRGAEGKSGATDAKLVLSTYKNLLEEWEMQSKNTCPHIKLATGLRSAPTLDKKRQMLTKLKGFLEPEMVKKMTSGAQPALTWIDCKNCKFRAVCPHVLVLMELEFRQAPYDEIKRSLRPFASEVKFAATSMATNYAFYCKNCSEELYVQVDDGTDVSALGRIGDAESDLKKFLWRVMMGVITPRLGRSGRDSLPIIRFDRPVNPSRFSSEAADICHPLVLLAKTSAKYRKISRRGDSSWSGSELNPYDQLMGVIYLYAYLFGMALGVPPKLPDDGTVRLSDIVKVVVEAPLDSRTKVTARRGRSGVPSPDIVAKLLLTHLVKTQSFLLSQLEGVTPEQIANQFQDAYGHIQDTYGRLRFTQQDSIRLFVTDLTLTDPFFALLRNVEYSDGAPPQQLCEAKSALKFLERVMGAPLQDLLSDAYLSNEGKDHAAFVRTILTRRGGIEYPAAVLRNKGAGWVYHSPEIRLYRKARAVVGDRALKYWEKVEKQPRLKESMVLGGDSDSDSETDSDEIASSLMDPTVAELVANPQPPIKDPLLAESASVAEILGGKASKKAKPSASTVRSDPGQPKSSTTLYQDALNLTILYSTWVHDDDTFKRYLEFLKLAREREVSFREGAMYSKLVPENNYLTLKGISETRQIREIGLARITKLYNEEGEKHVWDRYLWQSDSGGPDLVLSGKEIRDLREKATDGENPLEGYRSVDWISSETGIRWSETDMLSPEKVEKQLRIKSQLKAFFLYYESRCPEGGLHDFGDNTVCSKCGVDTSLLSVTGRATLKKEATAYYEKYSAVFKKASTDTRRPVSHARKEGETRRTSTKPGKPPPRNFDKVLELSKILESEKGRGPTFESPQTLIQAMGATEGLTIEEVREGKTQDPPKTVDDPKILAADNNVRELLNGYCRIYFRNKGRVANLPSPQDLDMQSKYFIPYAEAVASSREVTDEAQQEKWAQSILNFSIDSFCGLGVEILKAASSVAADSQTVASELQRLVRDILYRESLFTNHGEFQWAVFGDAEDTRGMTKGDSTGDDVRRYGPSSSGTEDVLAQKEKDYVKEKPGSEDRFSFDAVDIDRSTIEANLEGD